MAQYMFKLYSYDAIANTFHTKDGSVEGRLVSPGRNESNAKIGRRPNQLE